MPIQQIDATCFLPNCKPIIYCYLMLSSTSNYHSNWSIIILLSFNFFICFINRAMLWSSVSRQEKNCLEFKNRYTSDSSNGDLLFFCHISGGGRLLGQCVDIWCCLHRTSGKMCTLIVSYSWETYLMNLIQYIQIW